MQLAFDTMQLANFGSFLGKHELRLATSAPTFNLIRGRNKIDLRLGSNGSGKSTLLNALSWCLYGKTTNDLASTDIRPWHGKGQTSVIVTFFIDGSVHSVQRTAGPNSIKLDGKPALQPEIDRLLGMSFDVFRQTVLLGQNRPLFHDLPNREKLQFLSDVLDLERWEKYSAKAAALASDMEATKAGYELEYSSNKAVADNLNEEVENRQAEHDAWSKDRMVRFKAAEKLVNTQTKALEKIETKLADVASRLDMEQLQLKLADSEVGKVTIIHQRASLELVECRARVENLTARREEAEEKLKALMKERSCPTCGQPIKNQANFLNNKAHVERTISDYLEEASALDLDAASHLAAELSRALNRATTDYERLKQSVGDLEDEKSFFVSSKADEEVKLRVARKDLDSLSTAENPFKAGLTALKKVRTRHREDAESAKEKADKLDQKIARRRFWVKAFKDIRLFVLQDTLQDLAVVTNSMLDSIGLAGWQLDYAIERETKAGTLQKGLITTVKPSNMKDGGGVKWASWSGGESQRIRLVGALALSEVLLARAGVECNIEILDEPTKGLSTEGIEDICEFLSDRSRRLGKTIWLVDHKTIESSLFDRVVTVSKTKTGSALSSST